MKQLWDAQELADKWSLSFKDLELLSSKPHRNHLGFCSQLKYYQITGKFPDRSKDIPDTTLHYLNDQLKTSFGGPRRLRLVWPVRPSAPVGNSVLPPSPKSDQSG